MKNFNKRVLSLSLSLGLLLSNDSLQAQAPLNHMLNASLNYDSLTTIIDSIYSDTALRSSNMSSYKAYSRAKAFWKPRLGYDGTIKSG